MYTFILEPIPNDSTMQGRIIIGKFPLVKEGSIQMSFVDRKGSLNHTKTQFNEWANANCPSGGFICPENIDYTLDYLNSEMLAYEQIHKDQNDLGAEIVANLHKELIIQKLFEMFPPQEGDNWLSIDLDGKVSYHNRRPTQMKKNPDPAYGGKKIGYWVTFENYRNVGEVYPMSNWERHLYKVGDYPVKQYTV